MNVKTVLFLFMLNPILWTLAVSSFYYLDTLSIKNAKFNIQVISTYTCEHESNTLQRKFANSLNLPLSRLSSQCNYSPNIDTQYNISIVVKTYNFRLLQFEKNVTSIQNMLDNVYVACTYIRDDITRHFISTTF